MKKKVYHYQPHVSCSINMNAFLEW